MTINWSHLPEDVKRNVCFCSRAGKHDGWSRDPETGWWIHKCGKPSITAAVFECDLCQRVFVPKLYKTAQMSFLGIMCDAH